MLTRCSHEREMDLLYPKSNRDNIGKFREILDYFFLEPTTQDYVLENLKNTFADHKQEWTNNFLKLNSQKRAWYHISKNTINSEAYTLYESKIYNADISSELKNKLLDINNFENNIININGQNQKLIKFIKKNKYIDDDTIQNITTIKNSIQNLYLCISRNPIDMLFASTNQNFTSCLSLNSDYENAYYLGLSWVSADPNRFIAFISNGKFSRYTIKDFEFKHFKYLSRAWGIIDKSNHVVLNKRYPNDQYDLRRLISYIHNTKHSLKQSKFNLPFYPQNENADYYILYGDEILLRKHEKKFSYSSLNQHYALKQEDNIYYKDGFENLEYLDDLYSGIVCESCEVQLHEDDTYYYDGIPYCNNCFYEYYNHCYNCGDSAPTEDGAYINEEFYCEGCVDKYFTQCNDCKEFVDNDNITCAIDKYDNTIDVCEECLRDYYYVCDECGEYYHNDITIHHSNDTYCNDCYMKIMTKCEECGKYYHNDNMIWENKGTEKYCESCHEELFTECEECGEYYHNNEINNIDDNFYCNDCLEELTVAA